MKKVKAKARGDFFDDDNPDSSYEYKNIRSCTQTLDELSVSSKRAEDGMGLLFISPLFQTHYFFHLPVFLKISSISQECHSTGSLKESGHILTPVLEVGESDTEPSPKPGQG